MKTKNNNHSNPRKRFNDKTSPTNNRSGRTCQQGFTPIKDKQLIEERRRASRQSTPILLGFSHNHFVSRIDYIVICVMMRLLPFVSFSEGFASIGEGLKPGASGRQGRRGDALWTVNTCFPSM